MAAETEKIEERIFFGIEKTRVMKRRAQSFRMKTKSLCPVCLKVIDAELYEEGGKILMKKRCQKHGEFVDIYWGDAEMYHRFARWQCDGKPGIINTKTDKGCPFDCGLCPEHKSSTMLALIDLTNRCNQRCPTCFANAARTGYLYEPTMEQIVGMMELLRNEIPPCPAIQFAGGEPTIRDGFVDIVKIAQEFGFSQIQVATNGIAMAKSEQFCKDLARAGLHTVYLQFDGVTDEPYKVLRGIPALETKLKAIENCRRGGLKSVVLVPTLMKGVNDDQIGDIVRFAAQKDIVKGVVAQPISFEGRTDESERQNGRITIPDFINLLEEQTDHEIPRESFYPISFPLPVSNFIEAWKEKSQLELTVHPHCGAATYVFVENGKLIPITEFMDVEAFMEFIKESTGGLDGTKIGKLKAGIGLMASLGRFVDKDKLPKGLKITDLLASILGQGSRDTLAEFHRKTTLFIGAMHFMDPYNFDMERVKRCGIHYATPDGRIIPFCAYNAIHRPLVERKFSTPLREQNE